jgi:hypothetical protein
VNRGNVAVAAFVLLCVGSGLGMILFAWSPFTSPAVRAAFAVPVIPTLTPAPRVVIYPTSTPVPPLGTVGSTGHLMSGVESVLWVDPIALWAWNRAGENRDNRGQIQVLDVYQYLQVAPSTPVIVTNRQGTSVQVEIMSGPLTGRRGWMNADRLSP